jgi:MoaA/NifB/PqqE/SkfB family radical SAM enzyme
VAGALLPASSRLRVHRGQAFLSDYALRLLAESDIPYEILAESPDLRDDADAAAEVFYVPPATDLDKEHAASILRRSQASRFGILADEVGLVMHEVDRAALSLYYRPFAAQADEEVYLTGSLYRERYGAELYVPAPRQIYLGLTQKCNRSCTFCVSRTFDFDLLSVDEVASLCDQLNGSVDVIALTGAGEAMTHPGFWEIMDLLVARLPGVQFKMNTSGISLVKHSAKLLQYPIKNVTVSLNAATEATYERIVGPGFHAVLKGIAALVEARAFAHRDDLRICLSMVLMRSTVKEMGQLATIAAELAIEEIQGIYLMINDDALADDSLWHEPEWANAVLAKAARHAATLGVKASLPPPFKIGKMYTDRAQLASLPTTQGQYCTEAWSTAYIRPNGDVMSCPYMDRAMGNIRRQELAQVWNGRPYRELRRGLVSREFCAECRHCCGFNETGSVDEYWSHWLGERRPRRSLPITVIR